jgi:hypothetical protein
VWPWATASVRTSAAEGEEEAGWEEEGEEEGEEAQGVQGGVQALQEGTGRCSRTSSRAGWGLTPPPRG